jgi:hypothetical protein
VKHETSARLAHLPTAVVATLLLGAPPVSAHHSTAEYDATQVVEARGDVVTVLWRNPHVRFQVSTKSVDGNEQLWDIESTDLTRLDRSGLPRDILKVGDVVSFAGNPSKRTPRRMYATNLWVTDGREVLLRPNAQPRFAPDRAVSTEAVAPSARAAAAPATGTGFIGKVFVPARPGKAPAWVANPPLTPAAHEGRAKYDETIPCSVAYRPACRA